MRQKRQGDGSRFAVTLALTDYAAAINASSVAMCSRDLAISFSAAW